MYFFYEWSLQWQEANYCGLVTVPSPIKEIVQTTSIYLPYSFRTRVRFLLHIRPIPLIRKDEGDKANNNTVS